VATIGRLQGLPIDLLLTSHYPVYRGPAAADFLTDTLAYVERVDGALREALASSPSATLASLVSQLGPVLGDWPTTVNQLLCYPLLGHLERLERQRVVERVRGPEREVAWRLAD
jgi:hypothetical protein